MKDEESERVYVDHDLATALSDTLVQTALDADLNVLTTFAALQLAILSLSGIVLTLSSAPEDFDDNKKTLAIMSGTVTEALKDLTAKDLVAVKAQFEFAAQTITDTRVIH